jgi:fucose permease
MVIGLVFMAVGSAMLMTHSYLWGLVGVFCNGFGNGLTVPTGNLLVARAAPEHSSASLNLLNFSWSAGAVMCPFLVAAFQNIGGLNAFLLTVSGILGLLIVIALMAPIDVPESPLDQEPIAQRSRLQYLVTPAGLVLGNLFFVYVGTENALGTWLASYAERTSGTAGTAWVTIPAYFYAALLVGRAIAPITLRRISDIAQARMGAILACVGIVALLYSRTLVYIAGCTFVVGLGLSTLYPIVIGFLASTFGPAASRVAGVMFALSTVGGATIPWLVGYTSTQFRSLRLALLVPLSGCIVMMGLFWRARSGRSSIT